MGGDVESKISRHHLRTIYENSRYRLRRDPLCWVWPTPATVGDQGGDGETSGKVPVPLLSPTTLVPPPLYSFRRRQGVGDKTREVPPRVEFRGVLGGVIR